MNKVDNKTSMHLPTRVVRNVVFVGAAYLAIGMLFGHWAADSLANRTFDGGVRLVQQPSTRRCLSR